MMSSIGETRIKKHFARYHKKGTVFWKDYAEHVQ